MAEKGDAGTNGTNGTNGTDGTDLTTTLTTAGDVVYKGASALTRLAKGTASQVLTMNSGATAPEWSDAASGATGMDDVSGVARATSGLLFGSDTATANKLDDYEEGTWSPGFTSAGGGSVTTTANNGYYTKVGNVVTCYVQSFEWSAKTGLTSQIYMTGIPFNSSGTRAIGQAAGSPPGSFSSLSNLSFMIEGGESRFSLFSTNDTNNTITQISNAMIGSSGKIWGLSITYRTA
jgi:hypothetical protein